MGTSTIIAIISAGISTVAVIITVIFNLLAHKQYIKSLNPLLSFKLFEYENFLFLTITNTGKTAAKEIVIHINELINNGDRNDLQLDDLFNNKFELFPTESTQGCIALYGENISQHVFPYIKVDISFKRELNNKRFHYSRSIYYSTSNEGKLLANVKMDTTQLTDSIKSISRSNIRIANYLDGHQLASFDEIDLISDNSLRNEICEIFDKEKKDPVKTRKQTIEGQFSKKRNGKITK